MNDITILALTLFALSVIMMLASIIPQKVKVPVRARNGEPNKVQRLTREEWTHFSVAIKFDKLIS